MAASGAPLFIPHEGGQLFAMLYEPLSPRVPGVGIVICEPFAEEKLWAQRVQVNLARAFVERGFWVLALDCRGNGDSSGRFEEATVETRLSDISRAMGYLKQRAGVCVAGLFGLRFGGTLAVLEAARNPEVGFVLLWNPITDGERYFLEWLRSNLATQMTTFGRVASTREQLVRDILAGEAVSIDGYLVSRDLYRQMTAIDLAAESSAPLPPELIVQIAKSPEAPLDRQLAALRARHDRGGGRAELVQVAGENFWKETKHHPQHAAVAAAATLSWLERHFGDTGGRGGETGLVQQR